MPHGRPCLRSSVALPLGINGTRRLFIMAVSIQSRPKPAGPKATSVAGLRCGRLRPARFCEPQKFGPAVCRVRAARSPGGRRPSAQARRPCGSQEFNLTYSPKFVPFVLGAPQFGASGGATSFVELQPSACRGVGLRDPAGRRSSGTSTAPCPPHCGSAVAPPRFARLGKSCQNVPAHFDDFPCQASARGRALCRLELRSGRAGPTSRGREMLTHFHLPAQPNSLAQFSVRTPARFIYIRLAPKQLNRLLRRRRAVELRTERNRTFLERKVPKELLVSYATP